MTDGCAGFVGGSLADLCGVWAGRLYPDTKVRVHSFGAPSVSIPPPLPYHPLATTSHGLGGAHYDEDLLQTDLQH